MFWLPASGPQLLANNTILLGQDGWADGRLGDYQNSRVILNDSRMIADLFQESLLGIPDGHNLQETEIEKMLITHLQKFLLELGRGFAFIGRLERLTLL